MDKKLLRWMRASIISYFVDYIEKKNSLKCYLEVSELIDGNGKPITQLNRWTEARFTGPRTKLISLTQATHTVAVNFMVSTKLDQNNIYNHDDNVGIVFSAFTQSIPVLKLPGTDPVGCFQLDGEIVVMDFGQIDTDVNLTQSIVEAYYTMQL